MTNTDNWVEQIGAPAYESIACMVAALNCDYERLEELREAWADANQTIGDDFSSDDDADLK